MILTSISYQIKLHHKTVQFNQHFAATASDVAACLGVTPREGVVLRQKCAAAAAAAPTHGMWRPLA